MLHAREDSVVGSMKSFWQGAICAMSPEGAVIGESDNIVGPGGSPTLGPDGTLYVATRRGKIMAFTGNHGGLMKSPWPKYQHDAANSGRLARD